MSVQKLLWSFGLLTILISSSCQATDQVGDLKVFSTSQHLARCEAARQMSEQSVPSGDFVPIVESNPDTDIGDHHAPSFVLRINDVDHLPLNSLRIVSKWAINGQFVDALKTSDVPAD